MIRTCGGHGNIKRPVSRKYRTNQTITEAILHDSNANTTSGEVMVNIKAILKWLDVLHIEHFILEIL